MAAIKSSRMIHFEKVEWKQCKDNIDKQIKKYEFRNLIPKNRNRRVDKDEEDHLADMFHEVIIFELKQLPMNWKPQLKRK
jgi:hypothetical protein